MKKISTPPSKTPLVNQCFKHYNENTYDDICNYYNNLYDDTIKNNYYTEKMHKMFQNEISEKKIKKLDYFKIKVNTLFTSDSYLASCGKLNYDKDLYKLMSYLIIQYVKDERFNEIKISSLAIYDEYLKNFENVFNIVPYLFQYFGSSAEDNKKMINLNNLRNEYMFGLCLSNRMNNGIEILEIIPQQNLKSIIDVKLKEEMNINSNMSKPDFCIKYKRKNHKKEYIIYIDYQESQHNDGDQFKTDKIKNIVLGKIGYPLFEFIQQPLLKLIKYKKYNDYKYDVINWFDFILVLNIRCEIKKKIKDLLDSSKDGSYWKYIINKDIEGMKRLVDNNNNNNLIINMNHIMRYGETSMKNEDEQNLVISTYLNDKSVKINNGNDINTIYFSSLDDAKKLLLSHHYFKNKTSNLAFNFDFLETENQTENFKKYYNLLDDICDNELKITKIELLKDLYRGKKLYENYRDNNDIKKLQDAKKKLQADNIELKKELLLKDDENIKLKKKLLKYKKLSSKKRIIKL